VRWSHPTPNAPCSTHHPTCYPPYPLRRLGGTESLQVRCTFQRCVCVCVRAPAYMCVCMFACSGSVRADHNRRPPSPPQAMARVGLRKDPVAVPPSAQQQPPTTQLNMGGQGRAGPAPPMAGNSSARINSNASVTSTTFTNANTGTRGHSNGASTLSLSAISQSGVPLLAWGGVGDGSTVDTRDPIGSSHKDPLWRIPKKGIHVP
jgi:hypothetical protein